VANLERHEVVGMVMHAASVERRRALARALHEAPRVDPRFASLHVTIVLFRERAAEMFKKLVELEAAGNTQAAELRRALVETSAKVEALASVVGAPRAGESWDMDWLDEPTLPRR
jgi:hypothetical protein